MKLSAAKRLGAGAAALTVLGAGALTSTTAAAAPGALPMPMGFYRGDVVSNRLANTVWYGKSFTRGRVINSTAIGWAFPGKVYPGRSLSDGKPVIVVDYSGTPAASIRDELRPDGRGGYRGQMFDGGAKSLRFHLSR